MSIAGILGSSFSNSQATAPYQLTNSQFQQLGQDISSGNLPSAQSAFGTLHQILAQQGSTASTTAVSSSPLAQEFQQLSTDLTSGNLTAAQKDYSTMMQQIQNQLALHGHHHHRAVDNPLQDSTQNTLSSSTASQSTSTSAQAYASLAQQLQQQIVGGTASAANVASLANPISFMA